ncbi:MAG: hypothetical protein J7623_21150 [Chitinophaga sp.]|uniref:hypothetical protein n=1 Tax=Chitinophaga sp. TaxID=1869181 RepID=UPI001B1068BF|nr:hypothetical protein [Chitinophaga sp.]MBO9731159.1 hypothetical protein [Chitinophaga sp.]
MARKFKAKLVLFKALRRKKILETAATAVSLPLIFDSPLSPHIVESTLFFISLYPTLEHYANTGKIKRFNISRDPKKVVYFSDIFPKESVNEMVFSFMEAFCATPAFGDLTVDQNTEMVAFEYGLRKLAMGLTDKNYR